MNLNYLEETIRTSKYLVCLAGMEFMREQNVAYHRDSDESYRIEEKYGYSPEELFSARMFNTHAELFYEYYKNEILSKHLEAEENLTRRYRRVESLERIAQIRRLREQKKTIPEIKEILGCGEL